LVHSCQTEQGFSDFLPFDASNRLTTLNGLSDLYTCLAPRNDASKTTWPDLCGVANNGGFLFMADYKTVLKRKFQTGDGFAFFSFYRLLRYFWE
jgi:hypothetical protein